MVRTNVWEDEAGAIHYIQASLGHPPTHTPVSKYKTATTKGSPLYFLSLVSFVPSSMWITLAILMWRPPNYADDVL